MAANEKAERKDCRYGAWSKRVVMAWAGTTRQRRERVIPRSLLLKKMFQRSQEEEMK